jgi:hypothetical protein
MTQVEKIKFLRSNLSEGIGGSYLEDMLNLLDSFEKEQSKALNMHVVGVTLPSDKEIDLEVLDIIDKNLQCGTGQEEGILCNRFATTSFIRNYIKKIVGN